jgi:hypothetical protein
MDDTGAFALKVGKFSVDTDGNTLAASYTHETSLSIGPDTEIPATHETPVATPEIGTTQLPEVVEISHYSNGGLTKPLMGSVRAGKIVFTKVVFSEDVSYIPANDASAVPDIRYVLDGRETRYDVLPLEIRRSQVRSGDCKPIGETRVFLCRKSIPGHAIGEFSVNVGGVPFDGTTLTIEAPLPVVREPDPIVSEPVVTEQPQVEKTALQLEVAAAEATGLVGNSPLVRAIKAANRIYDRLEAKKSFVVGSEVLTKELEKEGLSWEVFDELSIRYQKALDIPLHQVFWVLKYWMIVEYLRIKFKHPEEDQFTHLVWYHQSAIKGRVPAVLRSGNPMQAPPPID